MDKVVQLISHDGDLYALTSTGKIYVLSGITWKVVKLPPLGMT